MLWLLRRRENLPEHDDPWRRRHGGDFVAAIVVRAPDADTARKIAQELGADEVEEWHHARGVDVRAWLDAKYSTCEQLTIAGPPGHLYKHVVRTAGVLEDEDWHPDGRL